MRDGGRGVVNHKATEASRGAQKSRHPVEAILERGYGLGTYEGMCPFSDIVPDCSFTGDGPGVVPSLQRAYHERD